MGGKANSVYLTVQRRGTLKNIFHKVFFNAKECRDFMNTEEFKNTWPESQFTTVRETY